MISARVLAVVAIVAVLGTIPAAGFSLDVHEAILKDALGDGNTMSAEALNWVTGSFFGGGNRGSDRHQMSPERHFDGARNPTEICDRWKKGFDTFLKRAVELAAPKGAEKRELEDRKGALEAFGEATHALADFYSHTNWVELHELSHNRTPLAMPQAPILDQRCDPAAFSSRLHSGYFSVSHGASGCPSAGPPAGYPSCHSQLAKDEGASGHGGDKISGNVSYHEAAVALSIRATKSAWRALHDRIVAKYLTDATDGECVFTKLAWGGERSCHRLWRVEGQITTHQEYRQQVFRIVTDLTLTTVQIRMKTDSVEYPGPRGAAVHAGVSGPDRVAGTLCGRQIMLVAPFKDIRGCRPFKTQATLSQREARLKVSPNPDPIELDWQLQFPGKKDVCPVVIRLDLKTETTQSFPNCAGTTIPYTLLALRFSGQFKVTPDRP
jgi:hypothetical protein